MFFIFFEKIENVNTLSLIKTKNSTIKMQNNKGYTLEEMTSEIEKNIPEKYVETIINLCQYVSTIKDTNVLRISMNPTFPYNLVLTIHELFNKKSQLIMNELIRNINNEVKQQDKEEYISQLINELIHVNNYKYEDEMKDLKKYLKEEKIENLDTLEEDELTKITDKFFSIVNLMIHNIKRENEISQILTRQ